MATTVKSTMLAVLSMTNRAANPNFDTRVVAYSGAEGVFSKDLMKASCR